MAPIAARPALFLAPHYDDVALSCGGTAASFAAAGHPPHIVTVFASELVHGMVGGFAAWKHERWGLRDPDAVHATRRAEDERAARTLGCSLRWLGLPDAIYRGDRYASDGALYGDLHPEEHALADHLAEEVLHLPEWSQGMLAVVPLGVGRHVDHQLVFAAGRRLAARGVEVWAYEDLPYGIHTPSALPARLQELGAAVGPALLQPVGPGLPAKLEAIAAYATQVPVIFRFTSDFRSAVRAHALAAGGESGPAERFWRVRAGDNAGPFATGTAP
ncbi:MAG TPA: PIG-L family deacetylase [Ramlibacter sp.]|jgi:LmbE family N-acetylglucosaminyl deacetylase|uniref:PIG-L deacetylase family protein n=1 Tax=Ramlibacter sp. TaxID=1917967 RepID=UPI002D248465|nr:PIG-L family deacetylase [Ramlibacter sp.]HZY20263.1 PIG-L family deacetylase [Ramlibacter sp.]